MKVDDVFVEQVSHFTYLGAIISVDGTLDKHIATRIGRATGINCVLVSPTHCLMSGSVVAS